MAKYFVTGATGTVGREVVESLLSKGQEVIAASRNPEKSRDLFQERVSSVPFDFADESSFHQVSESEGVFLLGPPLDLGLYELLTPFLEFVKENGPKRLVYLSANGMEHMQVLPFHGKMEAALTSSELDWRIVRPGFFMQNFGNYERENIEERKVLFVPAGTGKTAFISTKDIGASVAALLTEDAYSRQIFTLTGDKLSDYQEAASILSSVTGNEIQYANPDHGTYKAVLAQAGAPEFVADYMISVYTMIAEGKAAAITNDVEKLTGKTPESLEAVLRRDFA